MYTMIGRTHVSLLFFCALFLVSHGLDYSDLEALGLSCPERDKCAGYRNNETFLDRGCECDAACVAYRDCCIDVKKKASGQRVSQGDFDCLQYGDRDLHTGVYAIARCGREWNGSREIKERCEGPLDMSDPMTASLVTSGTARITYRNLYCAECNRADMESLQSFVHKLKCEGETRPQEEIKRNLSFDRRRNKWGIRSDGPGNSTFTECEIIFDLPPYLNGSVRLCRANIVSKCARDWTRPAVKKACQEYMAVLWDRSDRRYRNPHCALCNHKVESELRCIPKISGRRRPFSFSDLIDINRPDRQECPSDHILDPYSKRCRKLSCALPGYVVQDGSNLIDINRADRQECPSDHILDPYSKSCQKLSCALPGYVVQDGSVGRTKSPRLER